MFGRMIFAFFLLFLATGLPAQVAVPDTPAGKMLAEWLPAFNSGDRQKYEQFVARYPGAVGADLAMGFQRQTGGFTLLNIIEAQPDKIVAIVGEKDSDRVLKGSFSLTETAGARSAKIIFEPMERPAALAIARMPLDQALTALEGYANGLVQQDRLSGAMLIERDGKIVYRKMWGLADRDAGTPIAADTKFRLGSMNKMFTAVAILQLVDQNRVKLDNPVGRFLPDYPNRDVATKVTIRHLLTHMGGTGDIFGPEFEANRATLRTNEDYLRLYGARAPLFAPGTEERYSNYGFVLMGAIIARVSGETYYDYVERHIFKPAGMRSSGSLPEEVAVPGRVTGYMWKDGRWVSNAATLPYRGTVAGGGYSTLEDLLRFAHALEGGKLLSKAILAEATRSQTPGKYYGYGFGIGGEGEERRYGHGGGAPGMNAELRIYPAKKVVIVTLSNRDPMVASNLTDFFANRMPME